MRTSVRNGWIGIAGIALFAALAASPHRPVGYVVRAAAFQARLLWGRVPLDRVTLPEARAAKLARVPRIKQFAEETLGLEGRGTYDTVHPTWDTPVWNVTGCRPLAFEPRRYWFPVVGTVPYLGFFDEATARAHAERLEREGYETWGRPAGTYSTLGWFDDPLLPAMLDWSEGRLADTLIHELVHANVWVPGSVSFNESLASFVGEEGAVQWFAHDAGASSEARIAAEGALAESRAWDARISAAARALAAVYADPALDDAEKSAHRTAVFLSLPGPGTWNNARLLQFLTYNRGLPAFRALYEAEGSDLHRFLDRIRRIADRGGDPWAALAEASGVPDTDVSGS